MGGDAETYLRRIEALPGIPRSRAAGLAQLLAEARGGELANRDVRGRLGCSDTTAKNLLRVLSQSGLLRVEGDFKARRYLVKDIEEN